MTNQADGEGVINRGVDDAKAMALSRLQLNAVVRSTAVGIDVGAVEENVVRRRCGLGRSWDQRVLNLIGSTIVPVGNGEDTKILIVRQGCRTVNLDGADNTIGVLRRKVRVIPRGTMLLSPESVRLGSTRRERALGDAVGSVGLLALSKISGLSLIPGIHTRRSHCCSTYGHHANGLKFC